MLEGASFAERSKEKQKLDETMAESKQRTVVGVFFYVPNLIGYARVLLSLYSLAVALTDYKASVLCYALSFTCDYFDGFFARLCDQCTWPPYLRGRTNRPRTE
jgi:hypothetical protein